MIRAIFFDAGNTLVRMNYAAIARRARRTRGPVTTDGRPARRVAGPGAPRRRPSLAPARRPRAADAGDRVPRATCSRSWACGDASTVRAHGGVAARLQRARRSLDVADPEGRGGAGSRPGARPARGRHLELQRHGARRSSSALGLGPASRLRHRLLRGRCGEARSAHLPLALERAGCRADRGGLRRGPLLGGRAAARAPRAWTRILLDPGGHWGARDCPTAPSAAGRGARLLAGR